MAIIGEKLNKKLIVYFIFYQTNKIDLLYRALDWPGKIVSRMKKYCQID